MLYVRAGEFRNVRAGDEAEQSEAWATDNESRAKRGAGHARLVVVQMKKGLISDGL